MLVEWLARTQDMSQMAAPEARVVGALRLWVVMSKLGRCPMQAVADRLGNARAAAHLHLMLEEIGVAWPDPFCVAPLCCRRLSHDEALVIDMLRFGGAANRPGFDRLLAEMIPADMRERLYLSASVLSRVLGD